MSSEIKTTLKFNIDTIVIKRFKVSDLNGSVDFMLLTCDWSLRKRSTGAIIKSGSGSVDNADTDLSGNTIMTASMTIDLRNTDEYDRGSYYLVIELELDSGQTDIFRVPVELVDFRRKGAA